MVNQCNDEDVIYLVENGETNFNTIFNCFTTAGKKSCSVSIVHLTIQVS